MATTKLTPVHQIENFAVIIRCIHERGATQLEALAELKVTVDVPPPNGMN